MIPSNHPSQTFVCSALIVIRSPAARLKITSLSSFYHYTVFKVPRMLHTALAASACPRSLKRAPLLYQLSSPLSTLFSPPAFFPAYCGFSLNPLCFLKSICKIRSKYRQIYFYFSAKFFQVPMFICCGHSGIAKPPQILLQQLPMIRRSLQCSSAHPDAGWNSAEEKQAMIPKI